MLELPSLKQMTATVVGPVYGKVKSKGSLKSEPRSEQAVAYGYYSRRYNVLPESEGCDFGRQTMPKLFFWVATTRQAFFVSRHRLADSCTSRATSVMPVLLAWPTLFNYFKFTARDPFDTTPENHFHATRYSSHAHASHMLKAMFIHTYPVQTFHAHTTPF